MPEEQLQDEAFDSTPDSPEPGYLTLAQASQQTPYSQQYISLLVRKNKLPGKKFGRNWYIRSEDLKTYIAKQQARTAQKNGAAPYSKFKILGALLLLFMLIQLGMDPGNLNARLKGQINGWIRGYLQNEFGRVAGEITGSGDAELDSGSSQAITQIIKQINNYTSVASINEIELVDLISKSEQLKELLKGEKGERGEKGEQGQGNVFGPQGYGFGATVPTASNPGSIGGTTYFGSKELTSEKITVTTTFVNNGSTTLDDITVSGDLTVAGTTTLNGLVITNDLFTSTSQSTFTKVPTLAHVFAPAWPAGTSNASDGTIYINPASSIADGNLISAAVGGSIQFVVDAEGDVYANNLILSGSTSTGATTIAGNLTVQDSTVLGDAATDTITFVGVANSNLTFKKADPTIILDVTTATDTDFWLGVMDDAGSDDDDTFQIGDGTTPGTNPFLTIDTSGNVGIGTTGPGVALQVTRDSLDSIVLINSITSGNASLRLTTTGQQDWHVGVNRSDSGKFEIGSAAGVGTNAKLTIDTSGNVGIGTTGPDGKLHVHTATAGTISAHANADDLTIENSGSVGLSFLSPNTATAAIYFSDPELQYSGVVQYDHSTNNMNFYTGGSERVRIDSSGNVGIGTTNPGTWHDSYSGRGILRLGTGAGMWTDAAADDLFIGSNYYIPTGGADSYIGSGKAANIYMTAGDINFRTTNTSGVADGAITWTNAMTIKATGNVGIGTTGPGNLFDVYSSGNATANTEATYGLNVRQGSARVTLGGDASYAYIQSWNSKPLYINSQGNNILFNGNVGIGTTNPGALLSTRNTYNGPAGDLANHIEFQRGTAAGGKYYIASVGDGGDGAVGIAFRKGSTEQVRIDTNGNVGIGTTDPSHLLSLRNGAGNGNMELSTDASGGFIQMYDRVASTYETFRIISGGGSSGSDSGQTYFGANGVVRFNTTVTGSNGNTIIHLPNAKYLGGVVAGGTAAYNMIGMNASDKVAIASEGHEAYTGGFLGIKESDPVYTLDVSANHSSTNYAARIHNTGTNGGGLYIGIPQGSSGQALLVYDEVAGAANSNLMLLNSSGTLSLASLGLGYVCSNGAGTLSYGATCATSDERLKTNIKNISSEIDPVEAISRLNGVYFRYDLSNPFNEGLEDRRQIGLLAQNVEQVFPELVYYNKDDGYARLDYQKLVGVLVEGIKEIASVAGTFKNNLVAWLGDAANGIGDFFANRIRTKQVCISDESGETCITKSQLDLMLSGAAVAPTPASAPVPTTEEASGTVAPTAGVSSGESSDLPPSTSSILGGEELQNDTSGAVAGEGTSTQESAITNQESAATSVEPVSDQPAAEPDPAE